MECLKHALKCSASIIEEYLGGAVNCDAHHMTDPRAAVLVSHCALKEVSRMMAFHLKRYTRKRNLE
ncbi:beta-ketoacyl-[acyl-carrier-protein] synthase II [Ranunculus cassubicifolius]